MLKTIHGQYSLLLWKQNRNGVNILQPIGNTSYDDFIKGNVRDFFYDLKVAFSGDQKKHSFCKEWEKLWLVWWSILEDNVRDYFGVTDKEVIDTVVAKIKGNIGEIFAELFFTHCGGMKWIKPDTYTPVDPTNERFTDASASDPTGKVRCGIQVKNYSGEIPSQVFWKAAVEDTIAIRDAGPHLREDYLRRKRQFIFSFTEEKFSPNMEAYKTYTEVIGPKEIDKELEMNEFRLDILQILLDEIDALEKEK